MGDLRGRPEFPAPPSERTAPEPAVLSRSPLSADGGSHSSPLPSLGCTAAGWCEGRCVLVPFCPPPVSFLSTICPPPVLHLSHCCPSLVPHPHPHVPPQEPRGAAHTSPARNFSPLYCGQPAGMHGLLSPAIPPAIVLGDATDKSSRQKNTHTTHTQESFGPSNRGAGPANIVRLPCGVERPALLFLCHGIAERLAGGARVAASAGVVQMTLCAAGHLHSHLRLRLRFALASILDLPLVLLGPLFFRLATRHSCFVVFARADPRGYTTTLHTSIGSPALIVYSFLYKRIGRRSCTASETIEKHATLAHSVARIISSRLCIF